MTDQSQDFAEVNVLTATVIEAAIRIHRDLGPGLLESVYESLLTHSLEKKGLLVLRQQAVRLSYDGVTIDDGFRVDILVAHRLVVELKSTIRMEPVFLRQLLTYLRLMNLPVGLLINFGGTTLKEGLHRVINSRVVPQIAS